MEKAIKEVKNINFNEKYYYGTGSRKTAVARVRLYAGKGKLIINDKEITKNLDNYFGPLKDCGVNNKFDVSVKVMGGGRVSQIEAIKHGISRALLVSNDALKTTLRKLGYLTRDPRKKERKKPGLKRARRAPQWQKR